MLDQKALDLATDEFVLLQPGPAEVFVQAYAVGQQAVCHVKRYLGVVPALPGLAAHDRSSNANADDVAEFSLSELRELVPALREDGLLSVQEGFEGHILRDALGDVFLGFVAQAFDQRAPGLKVLGSQGELGGPWVHCKPAHDVRAGTRDEYDDVLVRFLEAGHQLLDFGAVFHGIWELCVFIKGVQLI